MTKWVNLNTQEHGGYDGVIDDPPPSRKRTKKDIINHLKGENEQATVEDNKITFPAGWFGDLKPGPDIAYILGGGPSIFCSMDRIEARFDIYVGDVIFHPEFVGQVEFSVVFDDITNTLSLK